MSSDFEKGVNRNRRKAFPIGPETTTLRCTPNNPHLGRKNERLMRQRNIKRVLGAVPRRPPTELVSLESVAGITNTMHCIYHVLLNSRKEETETEGRISQSERKQRPCTPNNAHLGRKNEECENETSKEFWGSASAGANPVS
ncbi:hypothetical protein CDAR_291591 [Caerostris darwini]|uniref:Uncharacterized protein n=1 Tax=Caerostris darwini TaxID=1538125 RepID=A0AAV4VDZ6_9ARAC|nr:hypothetical protein CDAR_291591 [Caerostris darwini]